MDSLRTKTKFSDLNTTTIGRGTHNDIVFNYPIISWEHALLISTDKEFIIEDRQSTNHTFVNDKTTPVYRKSLSEKDIIYFGTFKISAKRLIDLKNQSDLGLTNVKEIDIIKNETIFGRDPSSDVYLNNPQISWHHAKLIQKGSRYILKDLGSTNGTYVNGNRITSQVISSNDVITLSSFSFNLKHQTIVKTDLRNNIRIDADNITFEVITKRKEKKKILDNISLTIFPSEFVGLMGPAGAGKTTLMLAMNGYLPPSKGFSKINGISLYGNYDIFRGNIGYVPQDDIMHSELTVYEALYYTSRLRLPSDTSKKEIKELIEQNLTNLGLIDQTRHLDIRNVIIGSSEKKGISGGQRKRVNLAMELLTAPSILFLDEPTSGLSSNDTIIVMDVLKELSEKGKTIILTIHQPSLEVYKKMDNIIVVSSGKLMYFGPTFPDSLLFFNPDRDATEVKKNADYALKGLSEKSESFWQQKYNDSVYKNEYIQDRKDTRHNFDNTQKTIMKSSCSFDFIQWWVLTCRYFVIKKKDLFNTAILIFQVPIIALLIASVFYNSPYQYHCVPLFLIIISALWFGTSNSAREIVSEQAIYKRERMVNLRILSYIFSKFAVQSVFCGFQCFILVAIVYFILELQGNIMLLFIVSFLTSIIGIGIGLLISSISKTEQQAITFVPLVLIPMIILGGGVIPVRHMNRVSQTLSYFVPSRWLYELMLHVEDSCTPGIYTEKFFGIHQQHDTVILCANLFFIILCIHLTITQLRKRDIA